MGCLSANCFTICVLILQLVAIVERQVFDFLGYMWTCIAFNFIQIIFIIFALFGVCQKRGKIVTSYLVWSFLWIGWNIFIICLYLEAGMLQKDNVAALNMATDSRSWWMAHGYGCHIIDSSVSSSTVASLTTLPTVTTLLSLVTTLAMSDAMTTMSTDGQQSFVGCVLEYEYVEVLHAAIQLALALLGIIAVCFVLNVLRVRYNASQLVSGELEYIRMQHPSSLDRRTVPTGSSHPHQIYDVPRSASAGRPIGPGTTTDNASMKSGGGRRTPVGDRHSARGSGRRHRAPAGSSPPEADDLGAIAPSRPAPVHVPPTNELPYAVSGMAMRLPPAGRRTHDNRLPPSHLVQTQPTSDPLLQPYGLVFSGTQIPEATFI